MTIASKTNLLRIGFIGLGLGKGLTTDLKLTRYPCSLAATRRGFSFCLAVPTARLANDADGEGIEKNDQ